MKEKLVWLLAIFLLGDSALRAVRTNLTLGNAMMYGITVAVWGYALFQRRIDAFCAAGAGRVLKYVFFAGCGAYLLFALGPVSYTHLRRKARVNLFHHAAGTVFIDDLGDKIAGLFHCVLSPPHKVPARRAGLGSICFDYSVKPPVVQAKTVLRAQKAVRFAP